MPSPTRLSRKLDKSQLIWVFVALLAFTGKIGHQYQHHVDESSAVAGHRHTLACAWEMAFGTGEQTHDDSKAPLHTDCAFCDMAAACRYAAIASFSPFVCEAKLPVIVNPLTLIEARARPQEPIFRLAPKNSPPA